VEKSLKKGNAGLIVVIFSAFLVMGVAVYLSLSGGRLQTFQNTSPGLKSYTSQDLRITFYYPKDWFVIEKGFDILITSYPTYFDENKVPTGNQMELFISLFPTCFTDYEQDLQYPGCGEGGEASKNTIISKEERFVQAGIFYKYVVLPPRGEEVIYYLLFKDDKNILKIDKRPDPSKFEQEFEELVNSVKFLD